MLELPANLTDYERDKLRLDFAVWLAKRARRYRCEHAHLFKVITESQSPAHGGVTGPSLAEPKGDDDRHGEGRLRPQVLPDSSPAVAPSAADDGGHPAPMAEVAPLSASATHSPEGAPEVAASRARKPSIGPDAEPVRQAGGDAAPSSPKKGPRTRDEQQETTNRRQEVASLHEAEPWLSPELAAARLLMPLGTLRTFSSELDIAWSRPNPVPDAAIPAKGEARTLRKRVIAMHRMHPTWTARLIANALGAPFTSVSTYLASARKAEALGEPARAMA